jgi:hypothetical protein
MSTKKVIVTMAFDVDTINALQAIDVLKRTIHIPYFATAQVTVLEWPSGGELLRAELNSKKGDWE